MFGNDLPCGSMTVTVDIYKGVALFCQTKLCFQRTVTECGLHVVVTANVLAFDENIWDTLLSGHIQQSILDVSAIVHFIEFKDLVINLEVIKEARGLSAEWAVALGKDDNLKRAEQSCVSIIDGDKMARWDCFPTLTSFEETCSLAKEAADIWRDVEERPFTAV
jgi:hypothetical protein